MKTLFLSALLLPVVLLAPLAVADSPVFFRASFDADASATLRGAASLPVGNPQAKFESSEGARSVLLEAGSVIEYDLGEGFPFHAGSIEVRFKPAFPQKPDQPARTLFTLTGGDGTGLKFGFEPQGTRWQFGMLYPKWTRTLPAWYFSDANTQRWNHLVLTWDDKATPTPALRLFRDGKWERTRTEPYVHPFDGLRRLVFGGDSDARTLVDEVVIYREALSEGDVAFLHDAFDQPDRFTAWQTWRAQQAALARAEKAARKAQIDQLKGKVAQIISPAGSPQQDFRLPGGIVATGLRVEDVGKTDLSRFAVIYGPPGGAFQLNGQQDESIRQYVRQGGGYVGVCAGAFYGGKAKLLNMTTHSFKNQGLVTVGIQPHPITAGFSGEVVIHHGNGPIMIPGPGCNVVGTFQFGQHFPVTTAAIVAGENGLGRVVAFGPHPTGGGVDFQGKGAHFSGSELGSDQLLVNAFLWAAKITGDKSAAPQP